MTRRTKHEIKYIIAQEKRQIRHCALWHEGLGVIRTKVLFRDATGREYGYWMTRETYDSIPLDQEATPDDYKEFGEVFPSLDTDIYSLK